MTLATSPLYSMVNEQMNWLTQRQRVIAQNIANADTPNYQAKDLKPLSFKDEMSRARMNMQLTTTSPMHIPSPHTANNTFAIQRSKRSYETAPMKNNVVIEEQMMKLNSTQADYQLATTVYRQFKNLYSTSLGKGGA